MSSPWPGSGIPTVSDAGDERVLSQLVHEEEYEDEREEAGGCTDGQANASGTERIWNQTSEIINRLQTAQSSQ